MTDKTNPEIDMLSIAIHQLRTPLTRNKWSLDTLIREDDGSLSPSQKELLRNVYEDNERAILMINDILKSNRTEILTSLVSPIKVNIVELIEKTMHDVERDALVRSISFVFNKKTDAPLQVLVEPHKLSYVFENLFLNAVKYTPQGGSVTVEVDKKDRAVHISVTDNGIGIPKDDQSSIFQKFYRGSNARVVESEGTGLGLFMAKQIVEKNGGTMSFESVENKGSVFSLSFPIIDVV